MMKFMAHIGIKEGQAPPSGLETPISILSSSSGGSSSSDGSSPNPGSGGRHFHKSGDSIVTSSSTVACSDLGACSSTPSGHM